MPPDIDLTWEWPAERTVEQKLLVKVTDIEKFKSGIFGFKKTPSFAGNLPDPVTVTAKVVGQETGLKGNTVAVVLPKLELNSIKKGDFAVIGVIDSKICICIKHVESQNIDISSVSCQ